MDRGTERSLPQIEDTESGVSNTVNNPRTLESTLGCASDLSPIALSYRLIGEESEGTESDASLAKSP